MAESAEDAGRTPLGDEAALRALEARLARATAAAERLLADAEAEAEATPAGDPGDRGDAPEAVDATGADDGPGSGPGTPAGAIPPGGWQRRGETAADGRSWESWIGAADAELLLGVLAAARQLVPVELQQRLISAARDLLLALRALLDWCLERAQRRTTTPVEVQDIPIV